MSLKFLPAEEGQKARRQRPPISQGKHLFTCAAVALVFLIIGTAAGALIMYRHTGSAQEIREAQEMIQIKIENLTSDKAQIFDIGKRIIQLMEETDRRILEIKIWNKIATEPISIGFKDEKNTQREYE